MRAATIKLPDTYRLFMRYILDSYNIAVGCITGNDGMRIARPTRILGSQKQYQINT
jgi:hypothetical protein